MSRWEDLRENLQQHIRILTDEVGQLAFNAVRRKSVFQSIITSYIDYDMNIVCISNVHLSKTMAQLYFPSVYMISIGYMNINHFIITTVIPHLDINHLLSISVFYFYPHVFVKTPSTSPPPWLPRPGLLRCFEGGP